MTIKPQPFMEHKAYEGLKSALMLGLASGAYDNNFHLDDAANPKRMVNLVSGAKEDETRCLYGGCESSYCEAG